MSTILKNGALSASYEKSFKNALKKRSTKKNEESRDGNLKRKGLVKIDPVVRKGTYYFVRVVVTVMGLINFVPSTYFTSAIGYWMHKFRNVSLNTTETDQRTYLQNIQKSGTRSNKSKQLSGTINIGGSGEYNIITKLPSMYIKGFLHGEDTAGIFNGVIRLISVASSPTAIDLAIIYFVTEAVFVDYDLHYDCFVVIRVFITTLKLIWPMILLNGLMMAIFTSVIYNLVVSEHQGDNESV
ncbi:uncharacterized protein [Euwallacea fornicatus]|uniref:uncharacterized protein n=1 Tax=Euwallacea fornicatus TaxID=995702 RepID=UPI00338DF344